MNKHLRTQLPVLSTLLLLMLVGMGYTTRYTASDVIAPSVVQLERGQNIHIALPAEQA